MGTNSKIGWTHHTANFWWGCNKVSSGCMHCYIYGTMRRAGVKQPFNGPIRLSGIWEDVPRWNRRAAKAGERHRVFTCSMSDFFHQGADKWRADAWNLIREATNLDWLILSKRPELIADRLPADWGHKWPHVWLGATVENSQELRRIEILKAIPAAILTLLVDITDPVEVHEPPFLLSCSVAACDDPVQP